MKKGKNSLLIMVILIGSIFMTACSSIYTIRENDFVVDNGDTIRVKLDLYEGYDMTNSIPIGFSKDGSTVSFGYFIQSEYYDDYASSLSYEDDVEILDSGSNDTIEYIFWSYDSIEFNYAIKIKDSNSGFILGNNISEDSAKECFELLSFKNVTE